MFSARPRGCFWRQSKLLQRDVGLVFYLPRVSIQCRCFSVSEHADHRENEPGRQSGSVQPKDTSQGTTTTTARSNANKNLHSGSLNEETTPRDDHPETSPMAVSLTTQTQNAAQHPAHHFVAGGLPCDPSPPPFHLAKYGEESLYTLVLIRHGESEWNKENRFTGWCDVNLTATGKKEARTAGRLLYENKVEIDQAFTSVLKRASFSCNMALNTAQQHWVPVTKTWRLNERHYGALQGYNKETAWHELNIDQELIMQMRRAYDVRPPRMEDDHPYWHGNDRRYRKLTPEQLECSRAESLKDTAERIMPFFNSVIVPSLRAGNKCLVVSHANTIRTLIKQIDGISDQDIKGMTIPTGIPLLYRLDKDMKPVDPHIELEFQYMVEPKGYAWGTSHAQGFHGVYLGDLERLQDIQQKRDASNRAWQRIILHNVGESLGWDMTEGSNGTTPSRTLDASNNSYTHSTATTEKGPAPNVVETRQLWWRIREKMQSSEDYKNMLLLARAEDELENLMMERKQRFLTQRQYSQLIEKIHLDTAGSVVEPFVSLTDQHHRIERERRWYESLAHDMEDESLIK